MVCALGLTLDAIPTYCAPWPGKRKAVLPEYEPNSSSEACRPRSTSAMAAFLLWKRRTADLDDGPPRRRHAAGAQARPRDKGLTRAAEQAHRRRD
jgi:hypothetical protein